MTKADNPKLRQSIHGGCHGAAAIYQRLTENGKSTMAALGATMWKLIHIAYGVLKTQTKYRPQAA